jgi:hypothetical protein
MDLAASARASKVSHDPSQRGGKVPFVLVFEEVWLLKRLVKSAIDRLGEAEKQMRISGTRDKWD